MDHFFLTVLNRSILAGVVIIAVIFVRFLFKKAPRVFSYALWLAVLFRLVCPFSFESSFGIIPNRQFIHSETFLSEKKAAVPSSQTQNHPADQAATDLSGVEPDIKTEENRSGGQYLSGERLLMRIAEIIWISGMVILAAYSLLSYIKLKKSLSGAKQTESGIYEKEGLSTPFVLGLFQPLIYLPQGLSGTEREYILAHEKMHIHRLDHAVKFFSFCVLTVYWMNPLLWLAFVLMSRDMEMSCDEAVLRKMGPGIKKEYAASLLDMAVKKSLPVGTPLSFGEGNVKGRIKNVLHYKKMGAGLLVVCIGVVLAVILLFTVNRTDDSRILFSQDTAPQTDRFVQTSYPDNLEQMYQWRTPYVGDNSAVGNITDAWFTDETQPLVKNGFELQTSTEPYGITLHLLSDETAENAYQANAVYLETDAALLFSLIQNVGTVSIDINKQNVGTFDRTSMEESLGNLWAQSESYEDFCMLYQEISTQGIPVPASSQAAADRTKPAAEPKDLNHELTNWAQAFCSRDGEAILSMSSDNAVRQLEDQGLLEQAGGTASFGLSSPWPMMPEQHFQINRITDHSAEILYYAAVSDPHITVWHETLSCSFENNIFTVTSEQLDYMDAIATPEEYKKAYPDGINDTPMDYTQNGLGETLNQNALLSGSFVYSELFEPETAAVFLLNLLKNENKVQTDYGYLDDGTEDVFITVTFVESNSSINIKMTQPYGVDGIWVPQDPEQ